MTTTAMYYFGLAGLNVAMLVIMFRFDRDSNTFGCLALAETIIGAVTLLLIVTSFPGWVSRERDAFRFKYDIRDDEPVRFVNTNNSAVVVETVTFDRIWGESFRETVLKPNHVFMDGCGKVLGVRTDGTTDHVK